MRKMIFSSEKPQKINKIKKHPLSDYRSLHRIRFYLELQFRQHGNHKNVVVPEALRRSSAGQT